MGFGCTLSSPGFAHSGNPATRIVLMIFSRSVSVIGSFAKPSMVRSGYFASASLAAVCALSMFPDAAYIMARFAQPNLVGFPEVAARRCARHLLHDPP